MKRSKGGHFLSFLWIIFLRVYSSKGQEPGSLHLTQSIHDMLNSVMDGLIKNTSVRCMFHFINSSSNQNHQEQFILPTLVYQHENFRYYENPLFECQLTPSCVPGWVTGSCARTWCWTWTRWSSPPPSWRPTAPSCPSPATTTSSCSQHRPRRRPSRRTRSSNTPSLIRKYLD